jgi:uncharacterized Ntn-hydrolase superfamily protein
LHHSVTASLSYSAWKVTGTMEDRSCLDRLIATYSIVARDAATGQMGVAVQSCYFAVGTAAPWGEAGVGVVATQAFASADYGPDGLALLREGMEPHDALAQLLESDPGRELAQVALLDARGRVATHTGAACIGAAGHLTSEGVSVQANMMTNETVWPAMLDAYDRGEGDLAARLLAALEAAEAAGGDIRGRQSSALLVVAGERVNKPWHGRLFDLRVEDHPAPVTELARLARLRRAQLAHGGFIRAVRAQRMDQAVPLLDDALRLAPEWDDVQLSAAIGLYFQGRHDVARGAFRDIFARKPGLAEWLTRMADAGMVPADPGLLQIVNSTR